MLTPAVARTAAKPGRFAEGSEVGLRGGRTSHGEILERAAVDPAVRSFSVGAREGGEERVRGGIGDCGGRHTGGGEDNGKATGVGVAMTDCSDAHAGGGALTFSSAIIGSS